MTGSFKGESQAAIDRKIKDGRGRGIGVDYKPFIYTYEISSTGRSHRVFGYKSQRLHHLLSDLELAVFLLLDWMPGVNDIREQFPLRVDDTVRLAAESGITHRVYKKVPQILSSDFVVDISDQHQPQIAIQAKYAEHLDQPETVARLELERRYWECKEVPWYLITEKEISKVILQNIKWLYPAQYETLSNEDLHHYYSLFSFEFNKHPNKILTAIAQSLDVAYDMETGNALYWLRQLLARRYFIFDINKPYRGLKPTMLTSNDHNEDEYRYVSG